jgi:glutamate mutase epsilon subunit
MKLKSAEKVHTNIARAIQDSLTSQETANEIAFHMTDWRDDLQTLIKLYDENYILSDEEISAIIHQFLAHVPNHLAAAMKLIGYGPIEDIFDVGVLKKDE